VLGGDGTLGMARMSQLHEAEQLSLAMRRAPARTLPAARVFLRAAVRGTEREAEVVIRRAIGWALRETGDHAGARQMLRRAAATADRLGIADRIAEVAVTAAGLDIELGRFRQARQRLDVAARVAPEHLDVQVQRALVEWFDGDLIAARRRLIALQPRLAEAADAARFEYWLNLGMVLSSLGELPDADEAFASALGWAATEDAFGLALLSHNWAFALLGAGRLAEAMDLFDEADRRAERAGIPRVEFLVGRARALVDLRLGTDAVEAADAALALADDDGAAFVRAEAHLLAARARHLTGDHDTARTHAATAAKILRRQRRPGQAAIADALAAATPGAARRAANRLAEIGLALDAAVAHLDAANRALAAGQRRQAIESFAAAAAGRDLGPALAQAAGWLAAARLAELSDDPAAAANAARRGLTVIDRYAASLASQELRARANAHGEELATVLVRLAVRAGDARAARTAIRWWRARSLAGRSTPDPEVRRLLADLRDLAAQRSAATDAADIARLDSEAAKVERRIRRRSTTLAAAADADSETIEREPLDADVIELAGCDGRLIAVLSDEIVDVASLDAVLEERTHLGAALRRLARRPTAAAADAARESTDALRSLVAHAFADGDRALVVIPPPGLWTMPWHALVERPLLVAPSVQFIGVRRATGTVAAVAGPDLAGVLNECAHVKRIWPGAVTLLPPDSTVDAASALMASVSVAHLACHGSFRADNPMFSTLALSDGALTGVDIEHLDAVPDLVVLSACRSALTDTQPADEAIGLLTALLGHGVHAVVASPWPLPDEAAVAMLVELHRHLAAGAPLSLALHRARQGCDTDDPTQLAVRLAVTAFGADVLIPR
jgi:tetratricopeptide (TPR) repeat protein